jgi:hypothetical protein
MSTKYTELTFEKFEPAVWWGVFNLLVLKCTVRLAPSENERVALTFVLRCKYIFLARLVWYRASFLVFFNYSRWPMYNLFFFCFFVLESNMEKQQLEVSKDQILCVKVRKKIIQATGQ